MARDEPALTLTHNLSAAHTQTSSIIPRHPILYLPIAHCGCYTNDHLMMPSLGFVGSCLSTDSAVSDSF